MKTARRFLNGFGPTRSRGHAVLTFALLFALPFSALFCGQARAGTWEDVVQYPPTSAPMSIIVYDQNGDVAGSGGGSIWLFAGGGGTGLGPLETAVESGTDSDTRYELWVPDGMTTSLLFTGRLASSTHSQAILIG